MNDFTTTLLGTACTFLDAEDKKCPGILVGAWVPPDKQGPYFLIRDDAGDLHTRFYKFITLAPLESK